MTCKLRCKTTPKKPRKFTAKDVARIINAAKLNDSIENICQAIKASNATCNQKMDCKGLDQKLKDLRKKIEDKRGKPWFDVVKISIDDLTKVDSGFWSVVAKAPDNPPPNPNDGVGDWFNVNYQYDNEPVVIDDQGNIVSGKKRDPFVQKAGWFLDVRWIYRLYEALKEIFNFLPNINIFKGLFNFVDILLNSIKRIEEWLDKNCEKDN